MGGQVLLCSAPSEAGSFPPAEGALSTEEGKRAHLVGLDEAHKHREEDGGWSRLSALSEVVHHTVEGFLELGGGRVCL